MKNALARLEALERGTPGDKLLIVTEVVTPTGKLYKLPAGSCCRCQRCTATCACMVKGSC